MSVQGASTKQTWRGLDGPTGEMFKSADARMQMKATLKCIEADLARHAQKEMIEATCVPCGEV